MSRATGTFQDELRELRENLSHASSLIDSVQRFGIPSSVINDLQKSLSTNVRAIDSAFNRYRADYGADFERGDTIAAEAINSKNYEMQILRRDSYRFKPGNMISREEGERHGRDLEGRHNDIERDVISAFEALARRIGGGGRGLLGGGGGGFGGGRGLLAQLQSSWLGGSRSSERTSDGDTVVSKHDLSVMMQHLRDSWMVENVGGRTMYVNVYEPSLRRSDRPRSGFIQVESDRSLGLGYGGLRGRFDGIEGLGRGPLGLGLGGRNTGSIFDR